MGVRERAAHDTAVADEQRGQLACLGHVDERRDDALLLLGERLAAREAEPVARRAGEAFRFPGGESFAEQQERVVAALVDVTQARELPALLVCHRGVVRCALAHTHRRGLETYHEWTVPNAELIRL